MPSMYQIGIDSSTTNTAVVVLKDEEYYQSYLVSPKDKDIIARSVLITETVWNILDSYPTDNTVVGIEGASFNSRGMRDKLTMLLGALYYGIKLKGFSMGIMPPTTIKKQFTGNGRADKSEMAESVPPKVLEEFKLKSSKIDDLVDAYAIATLL